jgi:hypothetical protein
MSSTIRVVAPGAGRRPLFESQRARLDAALPDYFTSWRSAVLSFLVLAVIVSLLVVDLVLPLLG